MAKNEDQPEAQKIVHTEVYANVAQIQYNPYEFEVTMGLASANYKGARPVINVRMSPQFAKEFAKILTSNVALYEKNIGEINLPEKGDVKKK